MPEYTVTFATGEEVVVDAEDAFDAINKQSGESGHSVVSVDPDDRAYEEE